MRKHRIELTSSAVTTYRKISESAIKCIEEGDEANPKVVLLRTVDDLLNHSIAHDSLETANVLAGPFYDVYWISRGRLRIYFKASPTKSFVICILSISNSTRKETHPRHADALFAQMVASGQLDNLLSELGLQVN
jgi:hypothetical protein